MEKNYHSQRPHVTTALLRKGEESRKKRKPSPIRKASSDAGGLNFRGEKNRRKKEWEKELLDLNSFHGGAIWWLGEKGKKASLVGQKGRMPGDRALWEVFRFRRKGLNSPEEKGCSK